MAREASIQVASAPPTAHSTAVPVAERSAPKGRASGFCLTDRDLELLRFAAAHRFVLAGQVEVWLAAHEVVAYRRLKGLVRAGLLIYERLFHARPGCYRVSTSGLAVIESPLPRPTIDLRTYRHDVGVVWLWLAARRSDLGGRAQAVSEREMRSHDQRHDHRGGSFAIPLGGYAPSGKPRVHFPDVVLVDEDGARTAFELELTLKSRSRLEAILAGYGAERRIERVLYLTDSDPVASAVSELVAMFGLDGRVRVHYLERASDHYPERWARQIFRAGEVKLS
jgi:hypothetical protein